MVVEKLKKVLERLRDSYLAAGATRPAKDMGAVVGLLKGHENKPVGTFATETKALLNNGPPSVIDEDELSHKVVAKYVMRLLNAGTDRLAFDAAMIAIDEDADVGKLELFAIANRYRNEPSGGTHEIKFKSLKQARSAIRDVFLERFDAQSKRGAINKLTKRAS